MTNKPKDAITKKNKNLVRFSCLVLGLEKDQFYSYNCGVHTMIRIHNLRQYYTILGVRIH